MNDIVINPWTASVVVGLLNTLGAGLKVTPWIHNAWIPLLLCLSGGAGYSLLEGITRGNFAAGIFAGLTAIGAHQTFRTTVDLVRSKDTNEPPQ